MDNTKLKINYDFNYIKKNCSDNIYDNIDVCLYNPIEDCIFLNEYTKDCISLLNTHYMYRTRGNIYQDIQYDDILEFKSQEYKDRYTRNIIYSIVYIIRARLGVFMYFVDKDSDGLNGDIIKRNTLIHDENGKLVKQMMDFYPINFVCSYEIDHSPKETKADDATKAHVTPKAKELLIIAILPPYVIPYIFSPNVKKIPIKEFILPTYDVKNKFTPRLRSYINALSDLFSENLN